jgi:TolB-like protein/Tfp pilus assembly protein PilF/class 3 adenylate cyclase
VAKQGREFFPEPGWRHIYKLAIASAVDCWLLIQRNQQLEMSPSTSSEVKLEIGHVLFIDIVGYSQLLITQQSEHLETLKRIVRSTAEFQAAEAEGKLLRLPTGDGGALVFRTTPEAPVLCALEIAKELKKHPELRVRMGIHSGPVNAITDLNEQANIAGAGINIAQRVMDCGDAGHILVSKHVAEDLEHFPRWKSCLHDLGECEVKHGRQVHIVNFYDHNVGNAAVPERLKASKAAASIATKSPRSKMYIVSAVIVAIAAIAGLLLWALRKPTTSEAASTIPEKSIAVLPFESLSADQSNAYFSEGVQDEILTRLAKVADLKVISRTSTQHFKSAPDNLPQIAKQLGVSHILEGSVQKVADQVRVNVQLINAINDAHLWAETYDRKLTDIFTVESDIAKTIADTLQAKLSGSEKTEISKKPTENSEAYELYLKGRFFWNKRTGEDLKTAADYFQQAISIDPQYAGAYAGLAETYAVIPLFAAGTPQEYFPKAIAAAQRAIQLDGGSAEAHTALGLLLCFSDANFVDAEKEFKRAIAINPNYATAHHWYGNALLVALGRFDEAISENQRAVELDPLSLIINADLGGTLMVARRYDKAIAQLQRTLALDDRFGYTHWNLGEALYLKGDTSGAIAEYEKARSLDNDPQILGLLGRAYADNGQKDKAMELLRQLENRPKEQFVRGYIAALIYVGLGDKAKAIDCLEREYLNHNNIDSAWIRVDPMLDPLHGDARFEALVEKIVPARLFHASSK